MANDFRKYLDEKSKQEQTIDKGKIPDGVSKKQMDDIQGVVNKYKNSSDSELTNSLLSQIEADKRDGKYNPGELEKFVKNLAPMLNREQRGKLDRLMKKIK